MKTFTNLGLRIAIFSYAFLHFLTAFFKIPLLVDLLAIIGLLIFIFAIFHLTFAKFKLPIFIFIAGIVVFIFADYSIIDGILNGTLLMRNMVGFLIIVPLISWVLREEPYIEDIMSLFYNFINTGRKFYLSLTTLTQVLAYFLLFGSIPMMYQFVHLIFKKQRSEAWENFKGTALVRGFGLSTLWVISIPSFIFAVETLHASLWVSILQGFGIAIVGTFIAVVFSSLDAKKYNLDVTPTLRTEINNVLKYASSHEVRVKKVIEFFLLFLTLFGSIFLLHSIFNMTLMLLIPLVIICWICLYYLLKGKGRKLIGVFNNYVNNEMVGQTYQLSIMITVGVLIYALNQTEFASIVVGGLHYMQEHFPLINSLYLLPFIVIFLGFLGLGPLTVMVLVAGILESMSLPYQPELIVLAITSGSVISIIISPIVMPVIILSAANGLSPFTNGLKFNWKYAIVFYLVVQAYIQTMHYFS